jgi:hypothetical protein
LKLKEKQEENLLKKMEGVWRVDEDQDQRWG